MKPFNLAHFFRLLYDRGIDVDDARRRMARAGTPVEIERLLVEWFGERYRAVLS